LCALLLPLLQLIGGTRNCFLLYYNRQRHRSESDSRIEDWLANLPPNGIRQMCSWERFFTFAREPEGRKVGIDARITVEGVIYPSFVTLGN
jgi:hypothetical protein